MRKFLIITLFSAVVANAKTSAVIEEWNTHMSVDADYKLTITEFKRIKILNEEGYRMAVYFTYYDTYRKIRNLKYTIVDASGNKLKKLGKSDALDMMFNPSYEVGDARVLVLDPKYRSFPFTAEISVEIEYNGFIDFPDWVPRYAPALEVKKAQLTFEYPQDYEFRAVEINGVSAPTNYEQDRGRKSTTWTVVDLPSITRHKNSMLFSAGQPKVLVTPLKFSLDKKEGEFTSWQRFGDWYLDLNEGRNKLSAETKTFLEAKRGEVASDEQLIKDLYKHMQAKTRYISIQLGIGGFQSIPSDEVEKTGYGDCKALTNYMKAMLDYLKIPSNYILVRAGSDVDDVLSEFPSNQFNHVFLGVPLKSDTILLECTSQISPPEYIGSFTDDRNVLWITKDKSKIIRTPAYTPEDNVKFSQCVATIDEVGNAKLAISTTQSGVYFDDAMYYKSLPKDRVERFNYNKFDYKDFTIQSFDYSIPETDSPDLDLNYDLTVNGLARKVSDKLIVPIAILPSVENEFELDVLNKKCEIRRGFTIEEKIEINVPENFWVSLSPTESNENSEFGFIEITVQKGPGKIEITKKTVFKKGNYEGESFSRFYDYLKKVRMAEQGKIVLQSKT